MMGLIEDSAEEWTTDTEDKGLSGSNILNDVCSDIHRVPPVAPRQRSR